MLSSQQVMHYKEKILIRQLLYLKSILERLNVEIDEIWQDESSIGTYALRVVFKGTNIGTNGKGVSREYALASAYAEFFERYQNDLLGPRSILKITQFSSFHQMKKFNPQVNLLKIKCIYRYVLFTARTCKCDCFTKRQKLFMKRKKLI